MHFSEDVKACLELTCPAASGGRVAVQLCVFNKRTGTMQDVINMRTAVVDFEAHAEGYVVFASASAQVKTDGPLPWRLRILSARDFPSMEPRAPLPQLKSLSMALSQEDEHHFGYLVVPSDEERRFHAFVAMPNDPACKSVRLVVTLRRAGQLLARVTSCGEVVLPFVDVGPSLKETKENADAEDAQNEEGEQTTEATKPEAKAAPAGKDRKSASTGKRGTDTGAASAKSTKAPALDLSNPIELSISLLDAVPMMTEAAPDTSTLAEPPAAKGSGTKKGGRNKSAATGRAKKDTGVLAGLRINLYSEVREREGREQERRRKGGGRAEEGRSKAHAMPSRLFLTFHLLHPLAST